ncbi:hypothetical protein BH11BAC3_BH11BAC3_07410 [soil metagenome]
MEYTTELKKSEGLMRALVKAQELPESIANKAPQLAQAIDKMSSKKVVLILLLVTVTGFGMYYSYRYYESQQRNNSGKKSNQQEGM